MVVGERVVVKQFASGAMVNKSTQTNFKKVKNPNKMEHSKLEIKNDPISGQHMSLMP